MHDSGLQIPFPFLCSSFFLPPSWACILENERAPADGKTSRRFLFPVTGKLRSAAPLFFVRVRALFVPASPPLGGPCAGVPPPGTPSIPRETKRPWRRGLEGPLRPSALRRSRPGCWRGCLRDSLASTVAGGGHLVCVVLPQGLESQGR